MRFILALAAVAAVCAAAPGARAIDVSVFGSADNTCAGAALNTAGAFKLANNSCDIVPGSTDTWWKISCAGNAWTFTTHTDARCTSAASTTDGGTDATCTELTDFSGLHATVNCSATVGVSPQNSIVNNAVAAGLTTLAAVVTSDDYSAVYGLLNSAGNLTTFAPDDAAFAAANVNVSAVDDTTAVLQYHVLGAKVESSALAALQFPQTLLTNQEYVNVGTGEGQYVRVTKSDADGVQLSWGIPTTTAAVTTADVQCSNGVVHVINKVLGLPAKVSATASAAGLTDLVDALVSQDLVDAVDNTAQLTIFAPTDGAFDNAVLPGTDAEVAAVLKNHVVPGVVGFSNGLTDGQTLTTLEGDTLVVSISGGSVSINGSTVAIADVLTENGVVHVVDKVIGVETDSSPASTAAAAPAVLLLMALLAFFGSA